MHDAWIMEHFSSLDMQNQGFIQEKIGPKNEPFTKIGDLKTDSSQKSATLKRALQKNQRP